jgi:hypothetical protein
MYRKNLFLLTAFTLMVSIMAGCESDATYSNEDSGTNVLVNEDSTDNIWDANSVVTIKLKDNASIVEGSGASVSGNVVTVTNSGNYVLSGTLSNGQLIVNLTDSGVVRIILDGVNITTSSSSPIYIKNAKKAVVILTENSQNYLTDGSSYTYDNATEEEPNATIFSKEYLSFYGKGKLTINANFNDGISSKDGLVIGGGDINITAVDDGIRGKDYLFVYDASLTIKSGGDGLKSDKEDDASRGYIRIGSGNINITSGGDAISAQTNLTINDGTFTLTSGGGSNYTASTNLSSKGLKASGRITVNNGTFTISSADDCVNTNSRFNIKNGTMVLSTGDDGIHADSSFIMDNGAVTISKSYEAVESPSITLNDGTLNITASNDAINATMGLVSGGTEQNDGSYFYMNGGTLIASCTNGDGIDSNGNIVMTGGTVIVHGPSSQPEEAVDFNGSFTIKGGYFIGAGPYSNMFKSMSTASTQKNINIYTSQSTSVGGGGGGQSSSSTSSLFHIQDASGTDIVTFKPARSSSVVQFSSQDLKTGVTYSVYTGGTSTGTLNNGLYTGGAYSGGTLKKSFTLSTSGNTTSVSL